MRRLILLTVLSFALCSCATTAQTLPLNGKTHANAKLANDTFQMVSIYALAGSDCPSVESVDVDISVLNAKVDSASAGQVKDGVVAERWVAYACDQRIPFEVTFTPDGRGGAFYSVKKIED